jgi:hypothetical protein
MCKLICVNVFDVLYVAKSDRAIGTTGAEILAALSDGHLTVILKRSSDASFKKGYWRDKNGVHIATEAISKATSSHSNILGVLMARQVHLSGKESQTFNNNLIKWFADFKTVTIAPHEDAAPSEGNMDIIFRLTKDGKSLEYIKGYIDAYEGK